MEVEIKRCVSTFPTASIPSHHGEDLSGKGNIRFFVVSARLGGIKVQGGFIEIGVIRMSRDSIAFIVRMQSKEIFRIFYQWGDENAIEVFEIRTRGRIHQCTLGRCPCTFITADTDHIIQLPVNPLLIVKVYLHVGVGEVHRFHRSGELNIGEILLFFQYLLLTCREHQNQRQQQPFTISRFHSSILGFQLTIIPIRL